MKFAFTNTLRVIVFIAAILMFAQVLKGKEHHYTAFTVKVTGKGQPVLLLPGATCDGAVWNETVARYSSTYQCHVFTLAGYAGTNPLPNAPYLKAIEQQLMQYIADNKLEHVILVGHSIGGFLSLEMASEKNPRIEKVVVVDALPFFAATFNPNAPDTFSEQQAKAMYEKYAKMDDAALLNSQTGMARMLCRDSSRWGTIADWGVKSDRKTMAYTMSEMLATDLRKKVASINVPVLVLAAYCDNPAFAQYTRASVQENYSDQYKACAPCKVHVADGNTKHFIMFDNVTWMFAEIDNFLKG